MVLISGNSLWGFGHFTFLKILILVLFYLEVNYVCFLTLHITDKGGSVYSCWETK